MTTKALVILNDPAYGTERSYNGLRLAGALARREGVAVRAFLFGDAVGCAVANQRVPDGYYAAAVGARPETPERKGAAPCTPAW